jgi:nitrogen fixation protein NifU and related proteins
MGIVNPAALPRSGSAAILLNMFGEKLLDHFQHPRNAGELPGANVTIEVRNPVCGDVLRLSAIVEKESIREIRFLCRGCTASIACASFLTESVTGKAIGAIASITPETLAESLGGLPEASFHAAHLAHDALQALLRKARK